MVAQNLQPPADFYDWADGENVCFLCNRPRYSLLFNIQSFGFPIAFKKCRCGIVKQVPMPNLKFFEWFFNSDVFFSAKDTKREHIWGFYDYFRDEECRLRTSEYRYQKMHAVFDAERPLDIMKIGSSTGTFLHVANRYGHRAMGCDVSRRFVDYAQTHYAVRIDHGRFERLGYRDRQFDVIILFNVIENIPNLYEVMTQVRRTLKVGGYFIFNFVDMRYNVMAALQRQRYFLYRPPVCYIFNATVVFALLQKVRLQPVRSFRDVRYLHLEKVFTLLNWYWPLKLAELSGVSRIPFPSYAYPSRIMIAQRTD